MRARRLRLGVTMTMLERHLQRAPDSRPWADSRARHGGIRTGHCDRVRLGQHLRACGTCSAATASSNFRATWTGAPTGRSSASLFRFGLPTGVQGIAMNVGGVLLLRFIGSLEQSAAAQAAYAIGYTELFSMITWTSVGLMGAAATIAGQNLGAGHPERAIAGRAYRLAHRHYRRGHRRLDVCRVSSRAARASSARPNPMWRRWAKACCCTSRCPASSSPRRWSTPAGCRAPATRAARCIITLASQVAIPIGMCALIQSIRPLQSTDIWLAIVLGHFTRCVLSVLRFRQGKWRSIKVEIEGARAVKRDCAAMRESGLGASRARIRPPGPLQLKSDPLS